MSRIALTGALLSLGAHAPISPAHAQPGGLVKSLGFAGTL